MTRKPRRSKSRTARTPSEHPDPRREPATEAEETTSSNDRAEAENAAPASSETAAEVTLPADDEVSATSDDDTASGSDDPSRADAADTQAEAAPKIELPAFGFAADLLKKPADEAPQPEPEAETPTIDKADPERIFAFADSLERNAADLEPQEAPVRLETWVAFQLAGETFALPVEPVREVVRVASITRVPHAPTPIRGVTNMRGRVIPVIDLRLRIELPSSDLDRASRVIVASSRGRLLGLLVDAVDQVIHIDLARVQTPPDDVMTAQSDYISGVYHLEDQLILLLDIDRALVVHGTSPGDTTSGPRPDQPESSAGEATAGPS